MKKSVGQVLVMIRRALVGLVVTGLLVLQIPYVQDKLFARLLLYLSHTTQFAITHEQFQMRWLCYAEVTGLQIRDPDKQELLSAGQITLQISPLRQQLEQLAKDRGWEVFSPALAYCTDNAAMVAMAAHYQYLAQNFCSLDTMPKPRWSIEDNGAVMGSMSRIRS
ncbi:MAG: hypothetical protein AAFQ08_04100 [Bacteroidota bacterium]